MFWNYAIGERKKMHKARTGKETPYTNEDFFALIVHASLAS
jgi:hypothetical protein